MSALFCIYFGMKNNTSHQLLLIPVAKVRAKSTPTSGVPLVILLRLYITQT